MFFYFRGDGRRGDMYSFIFAERRDMYVFFDEQAKGCQFASFYKGSWRQISQKRRILTCRPQDPQIRLSGRPGGHVCFFIFADRPAGDMYAFLFSRRRPEGRHVCFLLSRAETCMLFIFAGTAGGETCMFLYFRGWRHVCFLFSRGRLAGDMYVFISAAK